MGRGPGGGGRIRVRPSPGVEQANEVFLLFACLFASPQTWTDKLIAHTTIFLQMFAGVFSKILRLQFYYPSLP
jgi:hypothetical protein